MLPARALSVEALELQPLHVVAAVPTDVRSAAPAHTHQFAYDAVSTALRFGVASSSGPVMPVAVVATSVWSGRAHGNVAAPVENRDSADAVVVASSAL